MTVEQLNGGEALIEVLRHHGVEHVFCSPGSEWHPVWEGLARLRANGEAAPTYINCRHEGLAVAAATGYTKVTGRPQAVLLHTNVGILNAALFIRAAYHEQVPMLICAGEGVAFGEDPAVRDPGRHWLTQLSDVNHPAALVAPYVKWQGEVRSPFTLVPVLEQAMQIAITPPQGPVALSIPLEVLLSPVGAAAVAGHRVCQVSPA
ncbi:MAG: thiamine pyrophosphate-binding protein, partial [Chloroflexota bacterium]